MSDLPDLMTETEAAEYLRVCVETLRRRRRARKYPKWVEIGKFIRYRLVDINEWLEMSADELEG